MMIFSELNNGVVSVNTMIKNFYNTFLQLPSYQKVLFSTGDEEKRGRNLAYI